MCLLILSIIPSILFLLLMTYLLVIVSAAHQLMYHPQARRLAFYDEDILKIFKHFNEITLKNSNKENLYGWWVPQKKHSLAKRRVVLLQHGFKNNRSEMLRQALLFYQAGFSLLITSIRAHDKSDGNIIYFAHHEVEDIHHWACYLRESLGFANEHIALVGNSLGGACILHAHQKYGDGAVLVLQSVFASIETTFSKGIQYFTKLPGKLFARPIAAYLSIRLGVKIKSLSPVQWAKSVSIPVFVMQGGSDPAVSTDSGEKIFAALQTPLTKKKYWYEPSQAHVGFERDHRDHYKREVIPFVKKYLNAPKPPRSNIATPTTQLLK